jgi:hypothetical protein
MGMKEEFNTTSTENLICPYCGAEQEEAREQEDWGTPESWTCCDCTRDFLYTTETVLKFTSEDLGEYLDDKLAQENYWLKVLEKELVELEKPEQLEKQKMKIEKCKQKINDLEERFKIFAAQCFEPIEE